MIRAVLPVLGLVSVLVLSACGADGEPERPEPRPQSGLVVTGSVGVGVSGGS